MPFFTLTSLLCFRLLSLFQLADKLAQSLLSFDVLTKVVDQGLNRFRLFFCRLQLRLVLLSNLSIRSSKCGEPRRFLKFLPGSFLGLPRLLTHFGCLLTGLLSCCAVLLLSLSKLYVHRISLAKELSKKI